jgi:Xaa-Pro aminopeptidase
MRYTPINKEFYQQNRKNFIQKLDKNSLAIFHSNDPMPTNADGTMGFRQNNDLFYLSGIDQEETCLVLDSSGLEILFVRKTDEHIKIWEGEKLTKEEAKNLSGISDVRWFETYADFLKSIGLQYQNIYLSHNEHSRNQSLVQTRNERLAIELKNVLGDKFEYKSSAPITTFLRYHKQNEELIQLKKACDITKKAFERTLKFIKPDVYEFEIEAEITHEFIRNKSKGHAYQPIIASGKNACVLHYIENKNICKDGDLILMDFGAEYGNYNADLTRTVPVNGRFSARQKDVYNACLRVHDFAKTILVAGNSFEILNKEVAKFMESELIGLGLLDKLDVRNQNPEKPLFRKYFMHGTSHSLGLDVHDVDDRSLPFAAGMVFTCEPGIYIPEEGIGIRIENDICITQNGNIDLMKDIPITVEEIEEIMTAP